VPADSHHSETAAPSNRPVVCEFVVESYLSGKRIDTFVGRHLRNWSRFRIQRMVQAGCVRVNDATVTIDFRVRPNDVVWIRVVSPPDLSPVPQSIPVEVLYEDPWLIAVNKPPGQIAHPGGEFRGRTLINALQFHFDQNSPRPGMVRPGIVHRIDRQTSGVMICPKEHLTHRRLTQQFERREISKTYVAIVRGCPTEDAGLIELPIGTVPNPTCTLMCAKPMAVDARPAQTGFRVLERFDGYTFVEARPLTGRHHQIRIHFAELGFPLLADEFYSENGLIKDGTPLEIGKKDEPRSTDPFIEDPFYDPDLPLRRHALHAATIAFDHPIAGMPILLEAPLPVDFQQTLVALRDSANRPAAS